MIVNGKFTPLEKAGTLDEVLAALDAEGTNPDRPFLGQAHTDTGERGKQLVEGLRMRDIRDCLLVAMTLCAPYPNPLYEKAESRTLTVGDIYTVDFSKVDPIAIAQNLTCEIEKMMGIYPNAPSLKPEEVE